jgi:hypothetical protein
MVDFLIESKMCIMPPFIEITRSIQLEVVEML